MHPDRQRVVINVQDQVVMSPHEAEADTRPPGLIYRACQFSQEHDAVPVVAKELSCPDRVRVDVKQPGGSVTKLASHVGTMAMRLHGR
jgi:hypothetical protein